MFKLDDTFLEEVGLGELPAEQKQAFLQHLFSELEMRVGTRLSEGLSEAQLEEFEGIIDKKEEVIGPWMAQHAANYHDDPSFQRLQQATKLEAGDENLRNEYAATKWLEVNRPDYQQVVAEVLASLKQEVAANKDVILGGQNGDSGAVAA